MLSNPCCAACCALTQHWVSQAHRTRGVYSRSTASVPNGNEHILLLNRAVAAVARAEALPQDALRRAHPRERCLEDLRLEQPELIVRCWASG